MPVDLLDRLVIVRTLPYSVEEIATIVRIRAQTEKIEIEDKAVEALGEIGLNTSLRYVSQLLSPAGIIARSQGRDTITQDDISEIDEIFYDAKASAKNLAANADKYIS